MAGKWHVEEFSEKVDFIASIAREKLTQRVCGFLNARGLSPENCDITIYQESDVQGSTKIVAVVFYKR